MQTQYNILVADDDFANRKLLVNLLQRSGYSVTGVENGRQALRAFETQFFHIVLTDWIMPELDGIGLCKTIREWNHLDSYIFIILLTAKNAREDILMGLKAGADDYLVKPFNPGELMARLNTGVRILNLEQGRKEAEAQIKRYSRTLEDMVRKRTRQLKTSEEKYHTILEEIEDGYYELDLKGYLTFFNDSTLQFGGYGKQELLGMHYREYTSKESTNALYQIYHQVFKTGRPIKRVEWLMKTKTGDTRFMDSSISLIRNDEGLPSGFRGIIRDMTDQKNLQAELVEKRRMAEAANQAKSEFLANMSHEIRTPLNGIIGMTELVLETQLTDHQKELLKIIESETYTLTELINHILDFSKIEAKKVEIENVPFDLDHTIEDLSRIMCLRTERKGLRFMSHIASNVPRRILGDPGKLRQILMNLFTNSLKFTHTGKIELRVDVSELASNQATLRFEVIDTGIGIASDKKELIFEPFTQADGSTTRKYGGTGLGTTISKQLSRLMGGEMGFDSEVEKGSTFWFTVKVAIDQSQDACMIRQKIPLENLRVLVVHASSAAMADLLPYINSLGCRVTLATSGLETLKELTNAVDQNDPFYLIITGGLTSDLDGFTLSRNIRNIEDLIDIPIILITATGKPGDAKLCREIGINAYLTGDLLAKDFKEAVMMVMTRHRKRSVLMKETLITRHSLSEALSRHIQILLVEDYPTNQQLAMKHLQNAGYFVDLAENGRQALQAFQEKKYDLILMDMQMPVMDGYTAIKHIRDLESKQRESNKETPPPAPIAIIATTAHAMKGDRELCLNAGADDYITKPLRKIKLLNMVEKWVLEGQPRVVCPSENSLPAEEDASPAALEAGDGAHLPIDFKKAVDEFEGDEPFFLGVLEAFLIAVNGQIEILRKAMAQGDAEGIRKEAHSIKGGAADLTARPLSNLAYDLEKMGITQNLTDGKAFLARLDEEYRFLLDYVVRTHPQQFADLLQKIEGEA